MRQRRIDCLAHWCQEYCERRGLDYAATRRAFAKHQGCTARDLSAEDYLDFYVDLYTGRAA